MQSSLFGLSLVFVLSAARAQEVHRKCYVCGPGSEEPFVSSGGADVDPDTIQSCDAFERATSTRELERFIRECPKNRYRGCTTQIDGDRIVRTCDLMSLNDCQSANGIFYCYCSENLCNRHKAIAIKQSLIERTSPNSIENDKGPPIDDEKDDVEAGSGDFSFTTQRIRKKSRGTYTITLKPVYQSQELSTVTTATSNAISILDSQRFIALALLISLKLW